MKNIILISLLLLGLIIDGYSQNDCPIITPPVNDNCGNAMWVITTILLLIGEMNQR